jgi:hypothetical protein
LLLFWFSSDFLEDLSLQLGAYHPIGMNNIVLNKTPSSGDVSRAIPSFFFFEGYYEHSKVLQYDMQQ